MSAGTRDRGLLNQGFERKSHDHTKSHRVERGSAEARGDRRRNDGASLGRDGCGAACAAPGGPSHRRGRFRDALAEGFADFAAYRTDVIFLCLIYPAIGLILASLASGYGMLPLLFPIASGFALVGPFAAIGLYEMSRRRERAVEAGWPDAFSVARAPAFGKILVLGLTLVVVFLLWLGAAEAIYTLTLGPEPPASLSAFAHDVLGTPAGWALIAIGVSVGFLFAVLVLMIATVSFPLLLDRDTGARRGDG